MLACRELADREINGAELSWAVLAWESCAVVLDSIVADPSLPHKQQWKLEPNIFRFDSRALPPPSVSYTYSGWNLPKGRRSLWYVKLVAQSALSKRLSRLLTLRFECDYHRNFLLCKLCTNFLLAYTKCSTLFSFSLFLSFLPFSLCNPPHWLPQNSPPLRFGLTRYLSLCTSPHFFFTFHLAFVITDTLSCHTCGLVSSLTHRWRMTGSTLPWWSIESSFGCLWPCASWEPWASSCSRFVASSHNC